VGGRHDSRILERPNGWATMTVWGHIFSLQRDKPPIPARNLWAGWKGRKKGRQVGGRGGFRGWVWMNEFLDG
jgi:hypothetical protein